MEWNHVRDESIAAFIHLNEGVRYCGRSTLTPSSNHVKVKNCGNGTEKCASLLEGFYPDKEREHEEKDGYGLVII